MNLNTRLKKLREDKRLIIERLRQEEAKASTRQRKRETRAKIILGAVVLSKTGSQREALLAMLLPHTTERDRNFINEHLAAEQANGPTSTPGMN